MYFEQSIAKTDEIIAKIEKGDVTLEQSLTLYEEGMKQLAHCREELNGAEFTVTISQ